MADESIKSENRKVGLHCKVTIKHNTPMQIQISSANNLDIYSGLNVVCKSDVMPEVAKNRPLDKDKVLAQINKTTDSPYEFKTIDVELDDNIFLPKISALNELRRNDLESTYNFAVNNIKRDVLDVHADNLKDLFFAKNIDSNITSINSLSNIGSAKNSNATYAQNNSISVLLNILNTDFDYSKLEGFENIYIPLKYFSIKKYSDVLDTLHKKFKIYIYMPTIIKANYRNLIYNSIEETIKKYNIKGFVISNISNINLLEDVLKDNQNNFELIANYTFNVFNNYSVYELKNLGLNRFTISPESNKEIITNLCNNTYLPKELIVYGNTPLMNMNYCVNRKD